MSLGALSTLDVLVLYLSIQIWATVYFRGGNYRIIFISMCLIT